MEERKASDILLNIESLIENQSKEINLLNFNLKLIIDRLNKLSNHKTVEKTEKPQIENSVKFNQESSEKSPENIKSNSKIKEVTVRQKVKYSDDNPIILARIRILDQTNKELKTTRTNTGGSWTLVLEPGEYQVHIVKEPSNGKPTVDRLSKFIVPDDKKSFVLPDSKG